MTNIAVAAGRADLFAHYGGGVKLPVVGWNNEGKAIVQKPNGRTGVATAIRLNVGGRRRLFDTVRVEGQS